MSIYYPSCPDSITDPVCTPCPEVERGRIRGFGFVKSTLAFTDITDPSEWDNAIGAAVPEAYVFPESRGTLDMTEVEGDGFGDQATALDGYEFTLNVMEPNYQENGNFWNDIKNSREWKVVYCTENRMHVADVTCTIIPKQPVEDDVNSRVVWTIVIKWQQEDLCLPVSKPGNVFDVCIQSNV